jgi:hypothetical protein
MTARDVARLFSGQIDHNTIDPRLPALNSKELPTRRRTAILAQDL